MDRGAWWAAVHGVAESDGGADTQRMVKGGHRLSRDSNTFWKKNCKQKEDWRVGRGEGEGRG